MGSASGWRCLNGSRQSTVDRSPFQRRPEDGGCCCAERAVDRRLLTVDLLLLQLVDNPLQRPNDLVLRDVALAELQCEGEALLLRLILEHEVPGAAFGLGFGILDQLPRGLACGRPLL